MFVVPTVPIVKDQSRVAGSANLPSGNPAVNTASMITGEETRIVVCQALQRSLAGIIFSSMSVTINFCK